MAGCLMACCGGCADCRTRAAMKVLYLVATTTRTNRENLTAKTNGCKAILNTPTVHCGDRVADHIR